MPIAVAHHTFRYADVLLRVETSDPGNLAWLEAIHITKHLRRLEQVHLLHLIRRKATESARV